MVISGKPPVCFSCYSAFVSFSIESIDVLNYLYGSYVGFFMLVSIDGALAFCIMNVVIIKQSCQPSYAFNNHKVLHLYQKLLIPI